MELGLKAEARRVSISEEEALRQAVAKLPLGRPAEPAEIADVVVFAASERGRFHRGEHHDGRRIVANRRVVTASKAYRIDSSSGRSEIQICHPRRRDVRAGRRAGRQPGSPGALFWPVGGSMVDVNVNVKYADRPLGKGR